MKYAYYPGCSLHSSSKEYDLSTRAVCEVLGIELEEIPNWVCCGASSAHMTSELLGLALPVKNLVAARDMHLDVVACCAACYSRLKIANRAVSLDVDQAERVGQVVGNPYHGETHVIHLLEVITRQYGLDALRDKMRREIEGLRVAAYYGCLLVRPPEVGFDDPENPVLLDKLVTALGGEPVDWPYKTECCGGSLSLTRTEVALKLGRDILQMAADAGAECLVVACPLCQANLDLRQNQINQEYGTDFHLPVIYFTQLMGLALGLSPKSLGLDKLMVNPNTLLHAKALI